MRQNIAPVFILLCMIALPLHAELVTSEITYSTGDTDMVGYTAYDSSSPTPRPCVLVVHEWWGHNEYARSRAEELAAEGYAVLAVDMYGDGKTADHPKEAGAFSSAISGRPDEARARFEAAMEEVQKLPGTDPESIGAIGYCFGGSTVLNMARMGLTLDAVVSVHGGLDSGVDEPADTLHPWILVCHGEGDVLVPMEKVAGLRKELDGLDATYMVKVYPDAPHSFSNPGADEKAETFGLPIGYDENADTESWKDILAFLELTLD